MKYGETSKIKNSKGQTIAVDVCDGKNINRYKTYYVGSNTPAKKTSTRKNK